MEKGYYFMFGMLALAIVYVVLALCGFFDSVDFSRFVAVPK